PPALNSSIEPPCPGSGPDCVPVPSKSPGPKLQPLLLWCAISCATVQYASPKFDCERRCGGRPCSRIACVCSHTSSATCSAPCARLASESRCGSGCGSPSGRANGWRNGANASAVTTHGEIVVPKFFDRNGPNGWYSHAWMSRADQSLSSTRPNQSSSACGIVLGVPSVLPLPTSTP